MRRQHAAGQLFTGTALAVAPPASTGRDPVIMIRTADAKRLGVELVPEPPAPAAKHVPSTGASPPPAPASPEPTPNIQAAPSGAAEQAPASLEAAQTSRAAPPLAVPPTSTPSAPPRTTWSRWTKEQRDQVLAEHRARREALIENREFVAEVRSRHVVLKVSVVTFRATGCRLVEIAMPDDRVEWLARGPAVVLARALTRAVAKIDDGGSGGASTASRGQPTHSRRAFESDVRRPGVPPPSWQRAERGGGA